MSVWVSVCVREREYQGNSQGSSPKVRCIRSHSFSQRTTQSPVLSSHVRETTRCFKMKERRKKRERKYERKRGGEREKGERENGHYMKKREIKRGREGEGERRRKRRGEREKKERERWKDGKRKRT